ncbi:UPF0481 protein At3g47200-like [Gossypium arboreum]|uniref:Uncharacterized protein n=1 Tax=Gossypium arboreum TaxID=29729 RepID=A0ABR0PTN5_GOSAR|nr:UPF0481 protein At3g47200-like [Gossypium arboreum]KAK5830368.1 hypothetical protein PVK06_014162 [Gossypium arboreum]
MDGSLRIPFDMFDMQEEDPYAALATSVRRELETLLPLPHKRCIFQVPDRLRQLNDKAYTPRVISIGRLHHGQQIFKPMELYKRRFLRDFLVRTRVSVKDCVMIVKDREAKLRDCFAQIIELSSDDFLKMVLFDAVFIVELLFRYNFGELWNDHILGCPRMIHDIQLDLCMIENQLPFFILEDLFNLAIESAFYCDEFSIKNMVLKFGIWAWGPYVREENLQQDFSHVEHVVDLLWLCFQPTSFSFKTEIKNFKIPSAMELQQAGVKLRPGSSKNLFDIRFNNGVLEIPQLLVMDRTKVIFRNLMAYEQHYCSRNYVTDYVTLISFLVKSPRDAQLPIKNGIIENFLKDSEEVSTLFKGLVEEVRVSRKNFELARVVEDMRAYCKSRWHRWNATLKQDYFNSPWRSLSIIAATLLLLLTLVQTVCAVIQVI